VEDGVVSRRAAWFVLTLIVSVLLAGTASANAESTTVGGTLRAPDGKPVAGVIIKAAKGGNQVGKATTAKNGTWQIPLPGGGNYTVTLDVSTLPGGLRPARQGGQILKDIPVPAGESRVVIFQLTTGSPAPSVAPSSAATGGGNQNHFISWLDQLAQLLVDGIKFGLIIAITAIGLSLVFGTTGLINFAQGELVTLGATIAFLLNASVIGPQLQLIPATIVTVALGAMIGGGLELGLWRPLRRRGVGRIQLFIVSIGLSLVIRHIILIVFGSRPLPYADYTVQKALTWGPISIVPRDLMIIILSLLVLVGVGLLLQRTRMGKAIRAVADNRDLAESSGIDVSRVILNVWLLSARVLGHGLQAAAAHVRWGHPRGARYGLRRDRREPRRRHRRPGFHDLLPGRTAIRVGSDRAHPRAARASAGHLRSQGTDRVMMVLNRSNHETDGRR
jgi:branched-chain amino acid transport system permease protein